jgi:hypothetical protein
LLAVGCAARGRVRPAAAPARGAPSARLGAGGPVRRGIPRPGPACAKPGLPAFLATVSGPLAPRDVPFSWHPGCPVPPGELRAIRLSYVGFGGTAHTGAIIANARVVRQVIKVFAILYRARFPIRRMEPVDAFRGQR